MPDTTVHALSSLGLATGARYYACRPVASFCGPLHKSGLLVSSSRLSRSDAAIPAMYSSFASKQRVLRVGGITTKKESYSVSVNADPPAQEAALTDEEAPALTLQTAYSKRSDLCEGGLPDVDMCSLPTLEAAPAVAPSNRELVLDETLSRGRWLLGLLVLQSTSSFVLDSYQDLLREHLVVTLFLTMLVGAGGNAGNQSAIKVIRGLATGSVKPSFQSLRNTLKQQAAVGVLLGAGLAVGGWVRVYVANGNTSYATSISLSLFMIVVTSVVLGTCMPFALAKAGLDPANAGTSIQVCMDILGVTITCGTCQLILMQFASSFQ